MPRTCSRVVSLCAAGCLALVCTAAAQSAQEVQDLFDGRSLDGWEGDPQFWRVENGAIVGEIPPGQTLKKNTWLIWRGGELADFDLRLQVKLTGAPAANSGIQFRCQARDVDQVAGYQADCDMGAVWLGRIYDEHGRALLVERGQRVQIAADGARRSHTFAPANQYAVLFRENAWNDYRIVAIGERVAVYVNGTLFTELVDQQAGQRDLSGQLAFQLHSGPETRVEFRNIRLETLAADDARLGEFLLPEEIPPRKEAGVAPRSGTGAELNLGFESGTLADWTATGDAFNEQPVQQDGISARWPGQVSNKQGEFFIGGYERVQDRGTGTLTSALFPVTHRYAGFLIGGGQDRSTRVEIIRPADGAAPEEVLFTAVGDQREQMRRVVADLANQQGRLVAVRLVDESRGGWGHLNFDDFRFYDAPPADVEVNAAWRSTRNPILHHLVPNPAAADTDGPAGTTLAEMHVPKGFSVDLIAAEPQLHQPMAFTFDARGRLWVVEGNCYPQKRPDGDGLDKILIFSDADSDGTFETRKVFTEGLNLVSGMEVGHGGVWVGAAPELLFIPDRNGDDRPDGPPEILLDGFGYADTHETLNSLTWGPDGWLYGNQGVFNRSRIGSPGAPDEARQLLQAGVWRYHSTRRVFEVFAHGGSNQWGLDFDEHGQLFMTHCRSFWGGGPTTHVIQGGHYWNQVNGGYAPFVSAAAPPARPWMRNYLLASARYGHGEGGAGKKGSREVYGGHSHVGTLIYLGDNWPPEYRNHLLTHNLHGHQLNHQINVREGSGYNTLHAGYDLLFCGDRQYVGVGLRCGPDGAVYFSDWYDPRHCHNPAVEQWDRSNGRIYRMKFDATWRPRTVDFTSATDEALAAAQVHPNDWHARMARLVLADRAAHGAVNTVAVQRLKALATSDADPVIRLRGLWGLHVTGALDAATTAVLLDDDSEYVRAWMVQLAFESLDPSELTRLLTPLAKRERSLFVRRYLASAAQRVPVQLAWDLIESLAAAPENAGDRELPQLIWFALAQRMEADLDRAMKLAEATPIAALRDDIHWYAAKVSDEGRRQLVGRLAAADEAERLRLLTLFELGLRGMRGLNAPEGWSAVAEPLYASSDRRIRSAAEAIGAVFGDEALFARMRTMLDDPSANEPAQRHAVAILSGDSSPENLLRFLRLLDSSLAPQVLPLLARYESPAVAEELIRRLPAWKGEVAAAAMEVLSSRAVWSRAVLDAIASGRLEKSQLSAYVARRMADLGDKSLTARLEQEWGRLNQTSEERQHEIAKTLALYTSAPLWAYSAEAGAAHFKKLCGACHQPDQQNETLGPRLAGTRSKGIEYVVENVIDPNAVIGRDYQARVIVTEDGRVTTGLIEQETDTALTVRTATSRVVIPRDEIAQMQVSDNSFMPLDLLKPLGERERIELLKYLMSQ